MVLIAGFLPRVVRHRSPSVLPLIPMARAIMPLKRAGGFWHSTLRPGPRARETGAEPPEIPAAARSESP